MEMYSGCTNMFMLSDAAALCVTCCGPEMCYEWSFCFLTAAFQVMFETYCISVFLHWATSLELLCGELFLAFLFLSQPMRICGPGCKIFTLKPIRHSWHPAFGLLCHVHEYSGGLARSTRALRWIRQWFIFKGNFLVGDVLSDYDPRGWHSRLLLPSLMVYCSLCISTQGLCYLWFSCG